MATVENGQLWWVVNSSTTTVISIKGLTVVVDGFSAVAGPVQGDFDCGWIWQNF